MSVDGEFGTAVIVAGGSHFRAQNFALTDRTRTGNRHGRFVFKRFSAAPASMRAAARRA